MADQNVGLVGFAPQMIIQTICPFLHGSSKKVTHLEYRGAKVDAFVDHTVDGRNPFAPPKKPWFLMIPL